MQSQRHGAKKMQHITHVIMLSIYTMVMYVEQDSEINPL